MRFRIFACFLATFVSNGLARFGYVVLIPIMILSGKMSESQSIQLGIAILVGYIFGSVVINALKQYLSLEAIAKLSFLTIALSFFACSFDSLPFVWAWIWRFLAGVANSNLMILAAPLSLPYIKERYRGRIAGLIFSGIGLGAVASGFVLPFIANISIDLVWYVLGSVGMAAFAVSFLHLRPLNKPKKDSKESNLKFRAPVFLWLLIASYALNAIGYLPHTLFWVDFLVRDLDIPTNIAGASWALFGIGAAFGGFFSGGLGDRFGQKQAHLFILSIKVFSCFIVVCSENLWWLNLSVFIMGFTTTGNVVLTNAMALQIVGKAFFSTSVGMLTFYFGIIQAVFSFLLAYVLPFVGYLWLFAFSGICLVISALMLVPIVLETQAHR